MAYTQLTLSQTRTQLALRLQDATMVFWSSAELTDNIQIALRIWNCLTGAFRERGTFTTTANIAFYNIPDDLVDVYGGLLRPYSYTDLSIYQTICRMLIEPVTYPYAGTEQFSGAEIVAAISNRRNRFLYDSASVTTSRSYPFLSPPTTGRIPLEDDVMDVRRAVWETPEGRYTTLQRSSQFQMTAGSVHWSPSTNALPASYSVVDTPATEIQLGPVPSDRGTLHLLVTTSRSDVDPAAPTALSIPDDYHWAVMFGAMADLLSKDGPSFDPARAAVCERLSYMGVELARLVPVILGAEINGSPVLVDPIGAVDNLRNGWEGQRTGSPVVLSTAGPDLIALTPVPNGVHSVTLDVVKNTPLLGDTDYLPLGREQLNSVLDISHYLSAFKMAGAEFSATEQYLTRALKSAYEYSQHLAASAMIRNIVFGTSTEESRLHPFILPDPQPEDDPDARKEMQKERRSRYKA